MKQINLEELSDIELLEIVDEYQKGIFSETTIIRKIAKQYFGGDSLVQLVAVSSVLLPIIAERMKSLIQNN